MTSESRYVSNHPLAYIPREQLTLRQALEKDLYDHGFFENECSEIFALFHESLRSADPYMHDRILTSRVSDYPPLLPRLLFMNCAPSILKWIDANKPQHWLRGVFAELTGENKEKSSNA